ncbi:MAG: hypothetical protein R2799_12245 [Crocinitomicaceae bacterium]
MTTLKFFIAFFLFGVSFNSTAQNTNEWTQFHSQDGFVFYMKYSECKFNDVQGQSWALVKLENTNTYDAEVTFYYETYLDGKCMDCGNYSEEKKKVVSVPAGATKEGFCKPDARRGPLDVFHKFTLVKARELTNLKVVNLSFEKIKIKDK